MARRAIENIDPCTKHILSVREKSCAGILIKKVLLFMSQRLE
jgi:hypothetical protein